MLLKKIEHQQWGGGGGGGKGNSQGTKMKRTLTSLKGKQIQLA